MTRWVPIPGYSLFEASDDGHIRRVAYPLFTKGPRYPLPNILRPFKSSTGYFDVNIPADGKGYRRVRVHRLVLLAFVGEPPEGKEMGCHRDGNKLNNHIGNLYWGDAKENAADWVRVGGRVSPHGYAAGHPTAKLTEQDVRWIKRSLADGVDRGTLADAYGVTRSSINAIALGNNWGWVKTEEAA